MMAADYGEQVRLYQAAEELWRRDPRRLGREAFVENRLMVRAWRSGPRVIRSLRAEVEHILDQDVQARRAAMIRSLTVRNGHLRADGRPKLAYPSRAKAEDASGRYGQTAYRCLYCHAWHLGTKGSRRRMRTREVAA